MLGGVMREGTQQGARESAAAGMGRRSRVEQKDEPSPGAHCSRDLGLSAGAHGTGEAGSSFFFVTGRMTFSPVRIRLWELLVLEEEEPVLTVGAALRIGKSMRG